MANRRAPPVAAADPFLDEEEEVNEDEVRRLADEKKLLYLLC
jgi:hypothetical protein